MRDIDLFQLALGLVPPWMVPNFSGGDFLVHRRVGRHGVGVAAVLNWLAKRKPAYHCSQCVMSSSGGRCAGLKSVPIV